MLQTRPNSATGNFQHVSQAHAHNLHNNRPASMARNLYSNPGGSMGSYRGPTTQSSVAPYAFTSTPGLGGTGYNQSQQSAAPQLRPENRTSSAPTNPYSRAGQGHQRHPTATSESTSSSSSSEPAAGSGQVTTSKDDSAITSSQRPVPPNNRPVSGLQINTIVPAIPNINAGTTAKPSPDRYRRVNRRAESSPAPQHPAASSSGSSSPSGSAMPAVNHFYGNSTKVSNPAPAPAPAPAPQPFITFGNVPHIPSPRQPNGYPGTVITGQPQTASVDDMHLNRQPSSEQARRYHRRSVSGLDSGDVAGVTNAATGQTALQQQRTAQGVMGRQEHAGWRGPTTPGPAASAHHHRTGSGDSASSAQSRPTGKRESTVSPLTPLTANPTSGPATQTPTNEGRTINVPPRGASDPNRRIANPSPLSRPVTSGAETPSTKSALGFPPRTMATEAVAPSTVNTDSPAAQQLSALNEKQEKKHGKSRLRRAFSFGSAAELRKASAENSMANASHERARLRKERYADEEEAEQAAIAEKQEAGGIGESIYSGQGHVFTGSTDNLSISSTASSASVMIRKMGKGMKKSTRSLVGLFRPKSVVGVPPMDGVQPEPSVAQVSMVTVEAEREKVNVDANPHDQVGGGTGYPKLERNSLDAATAANGEVENPTGSRDGSSSDSIRQRRSIAGGDRERAEVLSAVKKGILKRAGTDSGNSSPVTRPVDFKTPDFNLPMIPHVSDSPHSSAPSTPRDDKPPQLHLGHRRTDSVTIEGEDYFMSLPKFGFQDSKSAPGTPQSMNKYNVSFSPRIQFHDTWTSGEYDRRGEIATCNRLTPMLAQQIKEELNTFKMEMEVHEHSKVYTHFF